MEQSSTEFTITRAWLSDHMHKGFTTAQRLVLERAGVLKREDTRVAGWPARLVGKVITQAQAREFEQARQLLTSKGLRSRARRAASAEAPEPRAIDMVRDLDIALHGETWARPISPAQVWKQLLGEVRVLVEAAALEASRG